MNTSLMYEILLYLNSFYFGLFAICEFSMFIMKAINLTLPKGNFATELSILIFLLIIEAIRIFLGRKGNLTETSFPVIISIILTIPTGLGVLYFLLWQTYVLRLEWIMCSIQLTLHIAELMLATMSLLPLYKSSPY